MYQETNRNLKNYKKSLIKLKKTNRKIEKIFSESIIIPTLISGATSSWFGAIMAIISSANLTEHLFSVGLPDSLRVEDTDSFSIKNYFSKIGSDMWFNGKYFANMSMLNSGFSGVLSKIRAKQDHLTQIIPNILTGSTLAYGSGIKGKK
jgi:hypothetical protein